MKKLLVLALVLCAISLAASATKITLFNDTDFFIKRAQDIVVATCVSLPEDAGMHLGLRAANVRVLKVLKGNRTPGDLHVATLYPMQPGTTYMLYSAGGLALGTDFLAIPELSVVPLPATFKVEELDGKDLKEQVQFVFSSRLFELENQLDPLLKEKALLEKGVSDRRYEWFESKGPVNIAPIAEVSTQSAEDPPAWLDLEGHRLQWSRSSPGKDGFFYFEKMGARETAYWEFSPSDAAKIEDLVGKPLKAKFYGLYTPGRRDTPLGWTGPQGVRVAVGQVLLARTVDDPAKIFIIQILSQKEDKEQMSARYGVVSN